MRLPQHPRSHANGGARSLALSFVTGALLGCSPQGIETGAPDDDPGADAGAVAGAADGGRVSNRVTDGLVARYDFDGVAGQTAVADTSGVGASLDLVIADPAAVTWGAGFLTVGAPVAIASAGPASKLFDACVASDEITVEAWIRPAVVTTSGRVVASSSGDQRNFQLKQEDARYQVRVRTSQNLDGTDPQSESGVGTATIDAVQHVISTRLATGTADTWVDGVKQPPVGNSGSHATWDASFPLTVAADGGGGGPWAGELHLVAIYCRALSPAEVRQNLDEGYE